SFGVRRTDHRVKVAGERAADRRLCRRKRGAAVLWRDGADARPRLLHFGNRHAVYDAMHGDHFAGAEKHRLAKLHDSRIARRLERNLRTDAGGIAGGDRDFRLHSSLTPAARITAPQRSTSCRMKLAVSPGPKPIGSPEPSARPLRTAGSLSASYAS